MTNRKNEYGFPKLELAPPNITPVDHNRLVENAQDEFNRISEQSDFLAANDGDLFKNRREFRYTHVNREGINEARNHFQGIQRLRKGKYIVISGGDVTEPVSHLFVIRMNTRREKGPMGSNLLFSIIPDASDEVVKIIPLDKEYWHAGGLSLLGDILVIPLESDKKSKIIFLHMLEPENPELLNCKIDRPDIPKAGAAALAKLTNGKYICAIWWEEAKKKPGGRIDFYVSRSENIQDGFEKKPGGSENESKAVTWKYDYLDSVKERDPKYQAINFIEPADKEAENGVTRLFMVGTENTAAAAPIQAGKDLADFFEVLIPNDMFSSENKSPILRKIETRQFFSKNREYYNLDAAGGIYIDPDEGLYLYAGYHWRVFNTIRFAEFRSQPDPAEHVIDNIENSWIDLFEEPKFGGARLSILRKKESSIRDYSKIFVQGGGFDKKASSVRYQIPPGYVYRLYKNKSFVGQSPGKDFIDLEGTGKVEEIEDLKAKNKNFDNKISSSRYLADES